MDLLHVGEELAVQVGQGRDIPGEKACRTVTVKVRTVPNPVGCVVCVGRLEFTVGYQRADGAAWPAPQTVHTKPSGIYSPVFLPG